MAKPGPSPVMGVSRELHLRVRLASFEMDNIDSARGQQSRSDWVRAVLEEAARKKGAK